MLNRIYLLVFVAAFTILTHLVTVAGDFEASAAAPTRFYKAPVIDGLLDDVAWKNAPEIGPLVDMRDRSKQPSKCTTFKVGYDDQALYIAVLCHDSDVASLNVSERSRDDNGIFSDYPVEIFIEPERGGKEFCQFVCNAKGAVWDAKHTLQPDAGSASNSSWNGDWRAKTQVGKDGWTMEAVFPYSIFGISPVPGKKWGLGVNRNFKGGKSYGQIQTEYVMWSPSEKGFCDAKSFGVLWFDGEKEVLESLRVRMEKIRTVALSVRQKIEKCLEDKNVPRRTEFEQRTATLFNPLTSIEKNRTSPYVAAVEMETQCYKIQKEWQGLYWDIRFSMLLGE